MFNGKGIYEVFSGQKEFIFGKQPEKIEDTDTVREVFLIRAATRAPKNWSIAGTGSLIFNCPAIPAGTFYLQLRSYYRNVN